MPFPKDAKEAEDLAVSKVIQLSKWEGGDVCLKDYEVHETYTLGKKATLYCVTEDGQPVNLFTFSNVVIEQLEALEGELPNVIIHPKDEGTFHSIY